MTISNSASSQAFTTASTRRGGRRRSTWSQIATVGSQTSTSPLAARSVVFACLWLKPNHQSVNVEPRGESKEPPGDKSVTKLKHSVNPPNDDPENDVNESQNHDIHRYYRLCYTVYSTTMSRQITWRTSDFLVIRRILLLSPRTRSFPRWRLSRHSCP